MTTTTTATHETKGENWIGLTRAHTMGLIVPLLAALSPFVLSKYVSSSRLPLPINALISGCVIGLIAYVLFTYVPVLKEEKNALAKAVMCGILVAEVMVLKQYSQIPTMTTITLWLFLYYKTMENGVH